MLAVWFLVLLGLFGLARLLGGAPGRRSRLAAARRASAHVLHAYTLSRGTTPRPGSRSACSRPSSPRRRRSIARGAADPFDDVDRLPEAFGEGAGRRSGPQRSARGAARPDPRLRVRAAIRDEDRSRARSPVRGHWMERRRARTAAPAVGTGARLDRERARAPRDVELDPRFRRNARLLAIALVAERGARDLPRRARCRARMGARAAASDATGAARCRLAPVSGLLSLPERTAATPGEVS